MTEANPTTEQCVWTRMPDILAPLETRPLQFQIGCNGKVASGAHPFYPDECPHCHKLVKVATPGAAAVTVKSEDSVNLKAGSSRSRELLATDPREAGSWCDLSHEERVESLLGAILDRISDVAGNR